MPAVGGEAGEERQMAPHLLIRRQLRSVAVLADRQIIPPTRRGLRVPDRHVRRRVTLQCRRCCFVAHSSPSPSPPPPPSSSSRASCSSLLRGSRGKELPSCPSWLQVSHSRM